MLTSIEIGDFRCIEHARLEFHARGTGVVGPNGSGKTSLLEAIFFLGHGRSFRTGDRAKLIRRSADHLTVISRLSTDTKTLVASAEYGGGATRMRLGGQGVSSVSEIATVLPIQIIDPGVHRLIDEGSARRRRLLDWGVFHVEHDFLHAWRRYQRALAQRNAALREGLPRDVISAWEKELIETSSAIDAARARYTANLAPHFESLGRGFLEEQVELQYRRGWPADESLADSLVRAGERDRRVGTTTVGPHRADLTIKVDGVLARDRVSRGQQKMLAAALILAQMRAHAARAPAENHTPTCLLLDDPAAELDVDKLGKLLAAIAETPAQLVVTALTADGLRGIEIGSMFHVEQGRFARML